MKRKHITPGMMIVQPTIAWLIISVEHSTFPVNDELATITSMCLWCEVSTLPIQRPGEIAIRRASGEIVYDADIKIIRP